MTSLIARGTEELNRESPIPLYYQLKGILRSSITVGKFDTTGLFPSERELIESYRVSRMTVRRALSELVNEGLLVREQGRGSFVVQHRVQEQLGHLLSFTEIVREQSSPLESRVLDFQVVADSEVAKKMGIRVEEELVRLHRLRLIGDDPLVLQTTYVRHSLCPDIVQRGLRDDSLYKTLEDDYGLLLGEATGTVEAIPSNDHEASLLNITEGAPILFFEQLTYLQDGSPAEYSRSSYRGDRYRFTIKLARSKNSVQLGSGLRGYGKGGDEKLSADSL